MKIINLESKAGLALWSVVLGFFIERILFIFSGNKYGVGGTDFYWIRGYPISYYNGLAKSSTWDYRWYFLNLLFWVLTSFIILSVIRHFSKKSLEIASKHPNATHEQIIG